MIEGLSSARRIVVCAKEAGAGAFLAGLLKGFPRPDALTVFSTQEAEIFFREVGLVCQLVEAEDNPELLERVLARSQPDLFLLGASAGASPEKVLLLEARRRGIPVYSFVDHYWNLWQRFAHEQTAIRWHYLPDRIFVLNATLRERMIRLGCPKEVLAVIDHPVLKSAVQARPKMTRDETLDELNVSVTARTVLFVSEYVFPVSELWGWDQPREEDIENLLEILLSTAESLRRKGGKEIIVLVKLHPTEPPTRWDELLSRFDPSVYRVIGAFDKVSLIDSADQVWGLNSMLLLEAVQRGKRVYSFHSTGGALDEREAWLSSIYPEVIEVGKIGEIASILSS